MFYLFDNILIFGVFVFAAAMAIRIISTNISQKKPPPEEENEDPGSAPDEHE